MCLLLASYRENVLFPGVAVMPHWYCFQNVISELSKVVSRFLLGANLELTLRALVVEGPFHICMHRWSFKASFFFFALNMPFMFVRR